MTLFDQILGWRETVDNDIREDYLPEQIRETPFVWVLNYNEESGNTEGVIFSRAYADKFKPEGERRPALGVYEMLMLISVNNNFTVRNQMTVDTFWSELITCTLDAYGEIYRARQAEQVDTVRERPPGPSRLSYDDIVGPTFTRGQ